MRLRTHFAFVLTGLLCIAVGAAMLLWQRRTEPLRLQAMLREEYSRVARGRLVIGTVAASLRGRLTLGDVRIIPPGEQQPAITCKEIVADLDWRSLLRGRLRPRRVVLVMPQLDIVGRDGGDWWNVAQILKPGGDKPISDTIRAEVIVQNGCVRARLEPLKEGVSDFEVAGIHLAMLPGGRTEGRWTLRGQVRRGPMAGTVIAGSVLSSPVSPSARVDIECPEAVLDEALVRSLPVVGEELWRDYRPEGPVRGHATLRVSGAGGRLRIRGQVELLGITIETVEFPPAPIHSVFGAIEFEDNNMRLRDLVGVGRPEEMGCAEGQSLSPSAALDGVCTRKPWSADLDLDVHNVPITRKTLQAVPDYGEAIWQELSPSGAVDLKLLTSNPPGPHNFRSAVSVRLKNGRIVPTSLPLPVRNLSGNIEVRDEVATFTDMVGELDAAALGVDEPEGVVTGVNLSGHYDARTERLQINAQARDVPLARGTVETIPVVGKDIWQALRPAGRCDVVVDATVPRDGESAYNCVVSLRGAQVNWPDFPLPLQDLVGDVVISPDAIRFSNVRGLAPQSGAIGGGCHVSLNGLYDPVGTGTRLKVQVQNLRADEDLVKAVPGAGESLWAALRPQGLLDATLVVSSNGLAGKLQGLGTVNIRSGNLLPALFPVPLENVAGTFYLTGDTVQVDGLSGRLVCDGAGGDAASFGYVTVWGAADIEAGKGTFQIEVPAIYLDRQIVESIPEVGKAIWKLARPRGEVGLSGKIVYDGAREHPVTFFMDVQLNDASVETGEISVRAHGLNGHILLTEREVVSSSVTGRAAGGWFNAAFASRFEPATDTVEYEGTVEMRHVRLQELWQELTGSETPMRGRLSGLVQLSGRTRDRDALQGSGTVELEDGEVWASPFFLAVLDVLHLTRPGSGSFDKGRVTFELAGDHVIVKSFRISTDSLALVGAGTIGLDGTLSLTLVAAAVADPKRGIPIISELLGPVRRILGGIEREMVKLRVEGTVKEPVFRAMVLPKLTRPLGSLMDFLFGSNAKQTDKEQ